MKKLLSILLVLLLIFSAVSVLTACGKKDTKGEEVVIEDDTKAEGEEEAEEETEEETEAEKELPAVGDTVTFDTVSVTVPEGWVVKDYTEGWTIDIGPEDDSFPTISVTYNTAMDDHAKEWADNINENYGGDCEIDKVKIAGKEFYRVKADDEQNICFTDISDEKYLEVSVMFMPWDDAKPVLDNIEIK
jgi:predicted small lipoprotein YifL